MTTTTLHITVGDRTTLRDDALEAVRAAQAVETDARETADQRAVLNFGSYEDLVDTLTPLRLALLESIVENEPASMREAARLVDRDISDVHADLKQLEVLGVIELEAGGPGGAMQPVVPFDRIEMHIDYPLVDDASDDGAPARAD